MTAGQRHFADDFADSHECRKWGLGNGFQQVAEFKPRTVSRIDAPDVGSQLTADLPDFAGVTDGDGFHSFIPIGKAGSSMGLFGKDDDGC